eukprot:TRINITY_DN4489_c0_g1_i1.p1 TRINITY_DN4489_c0_g1~~TRINITY_DN4489_c0_g1_i1.p1  ORF type:complete len:311 (-),score=51.76 TRINITY_DN4489_c0_g1_i1:10-942(-)
MKDYIIATRPWSFTASIGITLVASAISYNSVPRYYFVDFILVLLGALFIHIAGNLINTYYDFKTGLDKKATADDRTLVDNMIKPGQVKNMAILSLVCAVIIGAYFTLAMPTPTQAWGLFIRLAIGSLLTIFYTATPVSLKYKGLGDVAIFICFGPLLVESVFYIHNNLYRTLPNNINISFYSDVALFSIPTAILIEALLHVNNTRDMDVDRKAGAVTLAYYLGKKGCFYLYAAMMFISYLFTFIIFQRHTRGSLSSLFLLLPLLTVPLALPLVSKFHRGDYKMLQPETAQLALAVGIAHALGIWASGVQA